MRVQAPVAQPRVLPKEFVFLARLLQARLARMNLHLSVQHVGCVHRHARMGQELSGVEGARGVT